MHTECNSWQYVFETRNMYVIIYVKEQIWLPYEIYVGVTLPIIGINILYRYTYV